MKMVGKQAVVTTMMMMMMMMMTAVGDFAADRAECAEELTGLLPCLDYVDGEARSPSRECCPNARTVISRSFKCLCVLVRDRNQPALGFTINVTRALTLPSLCTVPANISSCSRLLKLVPGSPAAQEFDQFEKQIAQDSQAKIEPSDAGVLIPPNGSSLNKWTVIRNFYSGILHAALLFLIYMY